MERRKVEKYNQDHNSWDPIEWKDIRPGDIIHTFCSDGTLFETCFDCHCNEFVAVDMPSLNESGFYGVDVKPLKGCSECTFEEDYNGTPEL